MRLLAAGVDVEGGGGAGEGAEGEGLRVGGCRGDGGRRRGHPVQQELRLPVRGKENKWLVSGFVAM